MSRHLGARPAAIAALLVPALAAVALSGCAAGTDALTSHARTTTNTVSGAVGTITLRNIYVVGPATKGGSAQIISAFFNGGAADDSIIGVSSPLAAGGQVPTRSALTAGGGTIYIANGSAPSLTGLKQNLLLGATVPVTFTFAKAGSVTVLAPVDTPAAGAAGPSSASGSPTASATPSGSASPSASPSVTPRPTATG